MGLKIHHSRIVNTNYEIVSEMYLKCPKPITFKKVQKIYLTYKIKIKISNHVN